MHLTLDRAALTDSLAWMLRRRAFPSASIAVFRSQAQIACASLEVALPCVGEFDWPRVAVFAPAVLRALVKAPPSVKSITFTYDQGRLQTGSMVVPATCQQDPLPDKVTRASRNK